MSLDTTIFVTSFVLIGVSLLLQGAANSDRESTSAELFRTPELERLMAPALLFTNRVRVAHC